MRQHRLGCTEVGIGGAQSSAQPVDPRLRCSAARRKRFLDLEPEMFEWAPAHVVFDTSEKSRTGVRAEDAVADQLRSHLRTAIANAKQELLVISPYFVPLDTGVSWLCRLVERGVRTTVLTNSLAATDVTAVHAGYARYREQLLECGVALFEVRQDAPLPSTRHRGVGMSQSSLHAKGFVVDRRQLFVGSFNWDPRSRGINTEMGVFIDSAVLARRLAERLDERMPRIAYELVLEDGKLRWLGERDGHPVVLRREPDTSFWRRFGAGLLEWLPVRSQL